MSELRDLSTSPLVDRAILRNCKEASVMVPILEGGVLTTQVLPCYVGVGTTRPKATHHPVCSLPRCGCVTKGEKLLQVLHKQGNEEALAMVGFFMGSIVNGALALEHLNKHHPELRTSPVAVSRTITSVKRRIQIFQRGSTGPSCHTRSGTNDGRRYVPGQSVLVVRGERESKCLYHTLDQCYEPRVM